jgi:aldose 1-epimerase
MGEEGGEPRLRLRRRSPDGEEGFPGNLELCVTFGLEASQSLLIRYEAGTDAPTPLSLTNHAYFNLRGAGYGGIGEHWLRMDASRMLESGPDLLPTGRILEVEGSLYDFRRGRRLGEGLVALGGYDLCMVLDRRSGVEESAWLWEEGSGRRLAVSTSFPGLVLYTGNFLSGLAGKDGLRYRRHEGLCLETQYFPDAPNRPDFPSVILEPGRTWSELSRYRFEF